MSKNQARRARLELVPIRNHPQGRQTCTLYQAIRIEKQGRACLYNGVLHWFNHASQERGYYGPTQGELRVKTGAAGHVGVQLEQTLV